MPSLDPGLAELLNHFSDVSFQVSPDLCIIKVFGCVDYLCGHSPKALEGKALFSLFSPESSKLLESHMRPLRARVQKAVGDSSFDTFSILPLVLSGLQIVSNSDVIPVEVKVCPYRRLSAGGYYYFVVLKDISYTQDLEKRQNAFLSMVNHELRTPLNGIIGLAESLKNEETNVIRMRRFDMLLNSAQCMLKLITGVISIADLKSNAADLNLSLVAVNDVVEEVCEVLIHSVNKRGHRLKKDSVNLVSHLGTDLPQMFLDKEKVYQAIEAIVNNALKFTDQGTVTISTNSHPETGGVQISIQDTGHGISPEYLARVFDSFQQEDERANMRQFEGLGLGLTLAKEVCELHGGRIWVRSDVGRGSTFSLVFPPNAKALKVVSMKQRNLAANFQSTETKTTERSTTEVSFESVSTPNTSEVSISKGPSIATAPRFEFVHSSSTLPGSEHIDTTFLLRPRCYEPISLSGSSRGSIFNEQFGITLHYDYGI